MSGEISEAESICDGA